MEKTDRELLLKDLCARLPYGVKAKSNLYIDKDVETIGTLININLEEDWFEFEETIMSYHLEEFKPYLRPMSSMTEEEKKEYRYRCYQGESEVFEYCEWIANVYIHAIDWLNAHHFDYRGLIERGLALEAPKDMYNQNK